MLVAVLIPWHFSIHKNPRLVANRHTECVWLHLLHTPCLLHPRVLARHVAENNLVIAPKVSHISKRHLDRPIRHVLLGHTKRLGQDPRAEPVHWRSPDAIENNAPIECPWENLRVVDDRFDVDDKLVRLGPRLDIVVSVPYVVHQWFDGTTTWTRDGTSRTRSILRRPCRWWPM